MKGDERNNCIIIYQNTKTLKKLSEGVTKSSNHKNILAVFILQTDYPSRRTKTQEHLICSSSFSSSSIKTGNRRIMRHNFLHLVIRRFRRTKCSDG